MYLFITFFQLLCKVAEIEKMEEIGREEVIRMFRNDAMVLDYLYRSGYKNVPKVYYSGYWCGTLFYVNALEFIEGFFL